MGEQERTAAAEERYNKKWLLGLLLGPLLLGLLAAAWVAGMADRLPDQLATHWNARNEVDGWMPLSGVLWMTVGTAALGAVMAPLAVMMRAQSTLLARVGVGFGLAFAVGLVALTVAMVAGQLDVADPSAVQLDGTVMAAGLAAAFAAGGAAVWAYRPGGVVRTENAAVAAANAALATGDSAAALDAECRAAAGESLRIHISMGRPGWLLAFGIGAAVAVGAWFIWPWLALLGLLLGGITWVFTSGTAVVGPDGVHVLAGGFWKVMPLAWREVRSVSVADVHALDHGGWGYRMNGGNIGFIMGNGPALEMTADFAQKFTISLPDLPTAARAAALAGAYVQAQKVKR